MIPIVDLVATDPAPWWGVPVVAGTFLILGGVVGGLISFLSARAAEDRRAGREDERRWSDELLIRSGAFMTARAVALNRLRDLQGTAGSRSASTPELLARKADQQVRYDEAYRDLIRCGQELSLIAPEDLRVIAREIADDLFAMQKNNTANDLDTVNALVRKNRAMIERVREIVRVPEFESGTGSQQSP